MKKRMIATSAALLMTALCSGQAMAAEKSGTIGIGSYVVGLSDSMGDYTFAGSAVVGSYNFTPLISASAHFYSTSNTGNTSFRSQDIAGYDALVRFGKQETGFTYFIGLGLYSETFNDSSGFSLDASGTALGFGIGYNWDDVALTYEGSGRSTADYEKSSGLSTTGATGSLNIAYRF